MRSYEAIDPVTGPFIGRKVANARCASSARRRVLRSATAHNQIVMIVKEATETAHTSTNTSGLGPYASAAQATKTEKETKVAGKGFRDTAMRSEDAILTGDIG